MGLPDPGAGLGGGLSGLSDVGAVMDNLRAAFESIDGTANGEGPKAGMLNSLGLPDPGAGLGGGLSGLPDSAAVMDNLRAAFESIGGIIDNTGPKAGMVNSLGLPDLSAGLSEGVSGLSGSGAVMQSMREAFDSIGQRLEASVNRNNPKGGGAKPSRQQPAANIGTLGDMIEQLDADAPDGEP